MATLIIGIQRDDSADIGRHEIMIDGSELRGETLDGWLDLHSLDRESVVSLESVDLERIATASLCGLVNFRCVEFASITRIYTSALADRKH